MRYSLLLGRILYAMIFIMSAPQHFTKADIGYAASQGVPIPDIIVPLAGIIALLGGLSIALGFRARIGAWLLVLFLVPVTLYMHKFWGISDATAAKDQMIHFMKNVALIGSALMITYLGSGPLSIDSAINTPKNSDSEK